MVDLQNALEGVILGTAAGDAIGLPREGLSARRAERIFGGRPYEHCLVWPARCGMVSDDTEHSCMVGQAILTSGGEPERFAKAMAWRLRGWFAAVPAGIGMATLKACLRLWLFLPPSRSGVRSAGNGPAMRAAILGVLYRDDPAKMQEMVRISSRITHTDDRAVEGALAIAVAAAEGSRGSADPIETIRAQIRNAELLEAIGRVTEHLRKGSSPAQFAQAMGWRHGVSGYICHTAPAALFCWLRYRESFRDAVEAAVSLGGDTDTVGAITGALAGATLGAQAIPQTWMSGLRDWPWSVTRMHKLAQALAECGPPVHYAWPLVPVRNAAFAAIVIVHGLRRLLPPY